MYSIHILFYTQVQRRRGIAAALSVRAQTDVVLVQYLYINNTLINVYYVILVYCYRNTFIFIFESDEDPFFGIAERQERTII